jgi:hypothetical protein
MQEERYLGRIQPGMDVCDVNGDKIGSITQIFRHEFANVANAGGPDTAQGDFIEVKTGFLGLGKHLFIPLSAVRDTTQDCLFLDLTCEQVKEQGWDTRPATLE